MSRPTKEERLMERLVAKGVVSMEKKNHLTQECTRQRGRAMEVRRRLWMREGRYE